MSGRYLGRGQRVRSMDNGTAAPMFDMELAGGSGARARKSREGGRSVEDWVAGRCRKALLDMERAVCFLSAER
jgi:hypothetical protein